MVGPPKITRILPDGSEEILPTIPQERVDEFYAATGYAINVWALLDRLLFQIFLIVLGADEKKAAILYYRQKEFGARLSIADDLLKVFLPPDMMVKWNDIKSRLNTKIRNILAHSPIEVTTTIYNHGNGKLDTSHEIRAQFDETELMAGRQPTQVKITYSELADYVKKIEDWETRLRSFKEDLEARLQSSPPANG